MAGLVKDLLLTLLIQLWDTQTDAMQEFNFFEPPLENWVGTFLMIVDGEIHEEQIFDSSVIDTEYKELSLFS